MLSAKGQGVFAVRLSDGLFGYLGPDGGSFAPVLDQKGVVFHDGESKAALRNGTTVVEYVPRAAIMRIIARTARPLVTGGPIRSISMDGPRVAVAVGDNQGLCDRVLYWNVAWWPAQRVSSPSGVTCMVRPHGVQITSVAIGGFRAEWLVTQDGRARLIAGSPLCQEWVLGRFARPASVRALAGRRIDARLRHERERPHDRVGGERPLSARARSRPDPERRASRSTAGALPCSGRTGR